MVDSGGATVTFIMMLVELPSVSLTVMTGFQTRVASVDRGVQPLIKPVGPMLMTLPFGSFGPPEIVYVKPVVPSWGSVAFTANWNMVPTYATCDGIAVICGGRLIITPCAVFEGVDCPNLFCTYT